MHFRAETSEVVLQAKFKQVNRVFTRGQMIFTSKDTASFVQLPLGEEILEFDLAQPCSHSFASDKRYLILSPMLDDCSHLLLAFLSVAEAEKFATKFASLVPA